jgi:hypothetical protein
VFTDDLRKFLLTGSSQKFGSGYVRSGVKTHVQRAILHHGETTGRVVHLIAGKAKVSEECTGMKASLGEFAGQTCK